MKKSGIILLVIIAIIAIIVFSLIGNYNGMVSSKEAVSTAYADLDTQLQRRTDLIPNLVNTVKGYTSHEDEIIDKITQAREALANATTMESKASANDELTSSLNSLLVNVENYPDLKSSANFIQLADELAGTENRIATARRDYNQAVKDYNLKIKTFPNNIIAGMFGFTEEGYFEADSEAKEVPSVNFNV